MTTPNISTELYLPKTYIFERKGKAVSDVAYMMRRGAGVDYVYLPKGLSMITITATALQGGQVKAQLLGAGGYQQDLTDLIDVSAPATRIWSGQASAAGATYADGGIWLKIQARNIPAAGQASGSVSVQIVNFPPEN